MYWDGVCCCSEALTLLYIYAVLWSHMMILKVFFVLLKMSFVSSLFHVFLHTYCNHLHAFPVLGPKQDNWRINFHEQLLVLWMVAHNVDVCSALCMSSWAVWHIGGRREWNSYKWLLHNLHDVLLLALCTFKHSSNWLQGQQSYENLKPFSETYFYQWSQQTSIIRLCWHYDHW